MPTTCSRTSSPPSPAPTPGSSSTRTTAPSTTAALDAARQQLSDTVDHVSQVAPPVVSQDGATAVITVQYDVPVTDFKDDSGMVQLEDAAANLTERGYQVELGGQMPENISKPGGTAELVGIGLALLILFLAFGSFVAAGLPIGVALVGLGIGSGGVTLLAALTDVTTIAPTLASMIGIGVGVDYALFIVTRHRDALARGLSVPDAAAEATATAGQSVFFAGGTVLLALSGLLFTGVPNFRAMGYAPGLVVLLIVAAAVTLLPALLGLAGMRVYSRKARRTAHLEAAASHSPTAARLAHAVAGKPVAWMVASTVLLLALAAPALGMKLGNADAGNEAESTTIRQAYDLVTDGFGPGANAPLLVAMDVDKVGGAAGIDALTDELAATRGVAAVSPVQLSPDGSAAVVTVTPTHGPQDDATLALLDRVRAELPDGRRARRLHPGDDRLHRPALGEPLEDRGGRAGRVLRAHDAGVPLDRGARQGGAGQPALDRGGLRRHHDGLPDRPGCPPAGPAGLGADRAVRAGADVRDPVRALDGLRGLPAQPGARGVPAHR